MTINIPENSDRKERWFKKLIDRKKRCMNLRSFVKKLYDKKLEKNQYFALRDMLDPKIRNIYYSTARQAGKTEVIAIYQALIALFPDCVIPNYEGKGHCYVFAPKKEQAQISFERFSNLIHHNKYQLYPIEEFLVDKSDRIMFQNGFESRAITASRNAEIEGLTTHIIILDESQHISPYKVRESIFPMGGGVIGGAKIIQCGVPGILGSHFHKAYRSKYHAKENPYGYVHHIYPWTECPRVFANKAYILGLKSQDDESFERNYELDWARNNFGYFVQEEEYDACESEYDPIEKRKEAVAKGWEVHWGLDFAKLKDSTVLTEMVLNPETEEFFLVRLIELKGVDYIAQIAMFAEMYNPSEIVHISVDQSSIGEVNIELMQSKSMNADGEVFSIQKKELIYKNFKHYIGTQKVHWPKKESVKSSEFRKLLKRFKQQLMELETEHRLTGHTSYHCNQNDNLARDDFPDSAGLCIWSATQYVPPDVGYLD